ncbi:glycosyltransferase [Microvirga calopogonii]|uniref:glycosyltransferase n=1 Tax=Microvirga calopogonii TaxID=2078013 RepID=UPI000E0D753E|nr:glycosyltransferase [Microvirga calopogonii]
MEHPRVSVVIPTYRMDVQLRECLTCLAQQIYRNFVVVVVDNDAEIGEGPSSRIQALIDEFSAIGLPVVAMAHTEPGSYNARHAGVLRTRSELIAFTDADCRPRSSWLESAVAAFDLHPNVGVISGPVVLFAADDGPVSSYEMRHSYLARNDIDDGCITANWLMSRRVYDELNGFDLSLRSGGDVEFSQRIKAAGYSLVWSDVMIVEHPTRTSLQELVRKHRRTLGGAWNRSPQSFRALRVLKHVLKRGWRRSRSILQDPKVDAERAAGILRVQRAVTLAELREVLRLALGGKPER